MLDGTTAAYTFTKNVYDHKGTLISSESNMFSNEIEGLAHGAYVTNVSMPDPGRPTIRDGNLVVANMPTIRGQFTPYGNPINSDTNPSNVSESSNFNLSTRLWEG